MTMTVSGPPPSNVGQFPAFSVTITGPDGELPSGVTVRVVKPDGSTYDDFTQVTNLGGGVWDYLGAVAITEHGTWTWNVSATGPAAGAWEVSYVIPYSPFTVETWDPDDFITGS